jgi:signal transduction histidine kinase
MSLSIGFWGFFLFLMFTSKKLSEGIIWSRALQIGAIFIPITFFHFVLALLDLEKEKRYILRFGYFISLLLLMLNFTPLFVKGASYKPLVKCFYPDAGPTYFLYILIYFIYPSYGCLLLYKASRTVSGYKRNQIKYVLTASIIGFLGGGTTFPLWYKIPIPPIGSNFVWLYAIVITIAIVRYRLMDVRVAITRTGIFVVVYSLVLGLPFAIAFWLKGWLIETFRASWWVLPLGLMAALATVGPFIYIYLQRKAEDRLLADQRRYQDILKQASVGMTRIRDLRRLLDLIAHIVTKTVRISYAGIYLFDEESGEYVLQISRDKGRLPVPKLASSNPLVNWLTLKPQPLVYDEIKLKAQDSSDMMHKQLEENMRLLTAAVVIPSFLEDRLLGFIVLGEKISGQIYTQEDLNVFQVLASQSALAIENAQFYEEAKKMQEQIAQAEKMATIGTMADGLSHQINNRLYALSLIAGDTIDTIKLTDTSKCTPEVREMIGQINHALERIQANVMQGGEVVRGLLKYSREGETGLEALDLHTILNNTLEMVQYKVKLSEIDIVRDFSPNIPKIKGNLIQLEEAFFNFIDNAYDAIVERRTLLKEEGYRGRITVSARSKDNHLEIVVEDNGMGVKEGDIKKVFTPFFTTKTSSHKGTGLGLYVIKRIITEMHKGQIYFESDYKVGTRFIIELPIAR